ncbi:MAG: class I SAM-dependent methyltransferase [Chitinophagales bacterium]
MLAIGRKKLNPKNAKIIEFVKGDSENLEYPNEEFDAMTVALV